MQRVFTYYLDAVKYCRHHHIALERIHKTGWLQYTVY